ncbi:MAG TPA: DNA repair protein RecN [Pseudonocardiaceae bacterium]|nr:DNA repair protein RecN [Pseudonocardiaceae bacterium]
MCAVASASPTRVPGVLAEMSISGLGVIDEATLELDPGLTVLTGETGAGKTMVVTGLHLLSGGRAEASRVRTGNQRAVVEGRFQLAAESDAAKLAGEAGAEPDEDGSLIAMRTVSEDGRSRAHLGGRSVPVGVLGELAEHLIAVHGQNDQLRLLRPGEQRAVLDRFAGPAVGEPLTAYRKLRDEWLAVSAELAERTERSRELAREADLLRHGVAEIEAVAPKPDEDTDLTAEARRLADIDQLRAAATAAQLAVAGSAEGDQDAPGAMGLVSEARRQLDAVDDPLLRDLRPRLAEAAVLLTDVAAEFGGYLDGLDADPQRLADVLARQAELKTLTRKYAADVAGVLAWAERAQDRLLGLDTSEETLAALATRRDELAGQLAELAERISEQRRSAAGRLAEAVTAELAGLAMANATLDVAVSAREAEASDPHGVRTAEGLRHAGPDGVDDVELLLRAHIGAPALPVHKGASGGELSRVMLALEVVLAHADPVPTLVFDEVDAGVGGRAAVEIGFRLAQLARSHQVIVVTHLAQVAAYADRHLMVDKTTGANLTRSGVRVLEQQERVVELARMLAGLESTDTGRAHAEELLAAASADKEADRRAASKPSKSKRKERKK